MPAEGCASNFGETAEIPERTASEIREIALPIPGRLLSKRGLRLTSTAGL